MTTVRTHETDLYEQMWAIAPYADHSPGEHYLPVFLDLVGDARGSVLDAGCGAGKGALALQRSGFQVALCDLTDAGLLPDASVLPFVSTPLWVDLRTVVDEADWVYCCDVLEHLPTAFTMLAVARLLEVSRRGAFFSICLQPDVFGAWVGQPLHQTVQSFTWWRDALAELGQVRDCRDLVTTGVYFVEPR